MSKRIRRKRPIIAFFDYLDVFEDFLPHYGVDQRTFATRWADSANHAFLSLLQREIGDVVWYEFSLKPELSETRHEVVGCKVKFLPSSYLHRCLWRLFYLPRTAWRWQRFYRAYATVASYVALASWPFIRSLWHNRPDFFFVQDYASGRFDVLLLIAKVLRVPLIAFHSGSRPEGYLGRWLRQWTIPCAHCLIASSHNELLMLNSRFRVSKKKLVVILTPIDITTYQPMDRSAACHAASLDSGRRYLLFVGRLDDNVKRVNAIIRAFVSLSVEHHDVDLLIIGDGIDGKKLRHLAAQCAPDRIRFLGWISSVKTKSQLYNAAECLVLASKREGFPTVVGEATACGTPVIASRVGGVSELVIDGQTGWLFEPGDDEALMSGLSFILNHPEIAASMRPQVRQIAVDRVSPSVVTAQLKRCFSHKSRHYG